MDMIVTQHSKSRHQVAGGYRIHFTFLQVTTHYFTYSNET